MSTPPSHRKLMEANGTSKGTVQRILATSSSSYIPPGPRGRPATLTPSEDAAVAAYVVWMEKSGFPAEKSQVEEAALGFLTARNIPNAKINKMWYPRFRRRHHELRKSFLKAVDRARKAFEASDVEDITKFFSGLQDIIYQYRIGPSECWNEDECGLRIGCL